MWDVGTKKTKSKAYRSEDHDATVLVEYYATDVNVTLGETTIDICDENS